MLLKQGSTGVNVEYLQRGLHMNLFPVGKFDGIYGSKVRNSVINFQKKFGLIVDGICGDKTWNKITILVKVIQAGLNKTGYNVGAVDGLAGAKTYSKLLEFQTANNIVADGMVGANTIAAFNAITVDPPTPDNGGSLKGRKIFIDPGHGGSDPGAIGNGLNEKDIVLEIAKKVGAILMQEGASIQYSRTTDVFVELRERATKANNNLADLFISIHSNSFTNSSANGTECFTKPSAALKTKVLSRNIAHSISQNLGLVNRGHKEANYTVITATNMPALLVETAFISNFNDANLLRGKQDEFAKIIADEIIKYFNY